VVGILGGVASGKSTVARLLEAQGGTVIDADRIGHEVLNLPHVKRQLRDAFGDGIFAPDGTINRSALGKEAFADARKLAALNRITHPPLIARIRQEIADIRQKNEAPMVILDAALLMETGLHEELCDALVFVDTPGEVRAERARRSRGWSRQEFRRRENAQIEPDAKKKRADFVVDNSRDNKELEQAVRDVWDALMCRFRTQTPVPDGSHGLRETTQ